MNRTSKKIVAPLVIFTAAILIATVAFLSFPHRGPLTPTETALVGNWSQVSMPDQKTLAGMAFGSDRTFCTNDGEFMGQWWISAEQLHIKYWRDEPTILPFTNALKNARADTEIWQITFDENGDHAELSQPGNPPQTALVRSR